MIIITLFKLTRLHRNSGEGRKTLRPTALLQQVPRGAVNVVVADPRPSARGETADSSRLCPSALLRLCIPQALQKTNQDKGSALHTSGCCRRRGHLFCFAQRLTFKPRPGKFVFLFFFFLTSKAGSPESSQPTFV